MIIDAGLLTTSLALLAFAVLTAANAGFVAAEFSLVTVDRAQIGLMAQGGDPKAQGIQRALRELSFQLSGAQLGITMTTLLAGYLTEPALSPLCAAPLAALTRTLGVADSADDLTPVAALTLATMLSMLFGELIPKNAALARPSRTARLSVGPQRAFSSAFAWLIRVLNGSATWIVRRFGVEPQEELASARSPEELGLLAAISARAGAIPTETAILLRRTIRFGEKRAAEAMTPRIDVIGLRSDATVADLLTMARRTGHSRFPVYEATLDQVNGIATVLDALSVPRARRAVTPLVAVCRDAVFVPGSLDLDSVLRALRNSNTDLAIVVDEYGGTDGVVTVEDLVEELVGEIADEHDVDEHEATSFFPPDLTSAEAEHTMCVAGTVVDGMLRADELSEQTGFRPPPGPYETLAGFLMARLGHIPGGGETLSEDGWEFTVRHVDRHRVEQVLVRRTRPARGRRAQETR